MKVLVVVFALSLQAQDCQFAIVTFTVPVSVAHLDQDADSIISRHSTVGCITPNNLTVTIVQQQVNGQNTETMVIPKTSITDVKFLVLGEPDEPTAQPDQRVLAHFGRTVKRPYLARSEVLRCTH